MCTYIMLQSLVMIMRHVVFQCDKNALALHCRRNTESTRKLVVPLAPQLYSQKKEEQTTSGRLNLQLLLLAVI